MEKKHWVWLGLALVAIAILFLLMRRKGSVMGGVDPTFPMPSFLTYNFGPRNIAMTSSGLPVVGDVTPVESSCGCSAGSQQLLSGFQSLMDYFTTSAKSMMDEYENVVASNIPKTVSMWFNNPDMSQSQQSYAVMGAYGGKVV